MMTGLLPRLPDEVHTTRACGLRQNRRNLLNSEQKTAYFDSPSGFRPSLWWLVTTHRTCLTAGLTVDLMVESGHRLNLTAGSVQKLSQ